MAKIYIARKDKLLAGYNGNLEHGIVHDKDGALVEQVYNGHFVTIEGLMMNSKDEYGKALGYTHEREVVKATLADNTDLDKDVFFIHNSEVMYDERLYKKADYYLAKGKVSRLYRLFDGDIVTMTLDCFEGTPKEGDVFAVSKDGRLGKIADGTKAKVYFDVLEDSGNELHIEAKAFAVKVRRA